ncbi:MAG: beta-N-acetylhexosaminidase [Burkholderiales bacterium]
MPLGPVMLDLVGCTLEADDRRRLMHPQCGGVILFSRNFQHPQQLVDLCGDIRRLREPALLTAVDHEGGRVQRFREGFTRIPPMRELGRLWDVDASAALQAARQIGYVIARELTACGVDFSFAPVLDLDYGASAVIGDRALHSSPDAVSDLGASLIAGLREAGVASVAKHFPGHGFVDADSHTDVPVDRRPFEAIEKTDLVPFARLARNGFSALMPAHVIYPLVDGQPAGFSRIWLEEILRGHLGFRGVIFSDDLTMEGARDAGGIASRARAALEAGCDMVLVCNKPAAADELLNSLDSSPRAVPQARLTALHAASAVSPLARLGEDRKYAAALTTIAALATSSQTRVA